MSIDFFVSKAPGWTPYNGMWNNPISFLDPDGNWPIYGKNGEYLGDDGKSEKGKDLAFIGKVTKRDSKGIATEFGDLVQFTDKHASFQIASNVIWKESSGDETESLWIAHTANNAQKERDINYKIPKNQDVFQQLMDKDYSTSGPRVPLNINDNSDRAKFARAGLIDVLTGGQDPTDNAVLWDGLDFLHSSFSGNKFREYNHIRIRTSHLKPFTDFYGDSYNRMRIDINKVVRCEFVEYGTVPGKYSFNTKFWSGSGRKKEGYSLRSAASHGGTIFWHMYISK